MQRVSIIIPCFNEEAGIPLLATRLLPVMADLSRTTEVELVVVDDGSTDGTHGALVRLFASLPDAHVLRHDRNRGITAAIATGFAAAGGEILCTLDSDCTYDPGLLPLLIAPIAAGHADVATASPYHPLGGVGIVPLWRLFLSRSASWVYRRLLPVRLYTYTSCCRAYRASVARRLSFTDPGFLGITELMVSAILGGLRVVEVPAHLGGRSHGVSKMRTFQILFKHLALVSRVVLDRWHLLRRREVPSG